MGACLATTGVASAADSVFQRVKGMFHPRLTDLFEAFGVIGSAAHTIEILWDDGVIVTTPNDGKYNDSTGDTGRAQYVYRVCEAGTGTC